MALTDAVAPETRDPSPRRAPRRSLLSRVSTGHVLMVLAGLLAALLNFTVLRSADDAVAVAVAGRDIRSGDVVAADDFASVDVQADQDLVAALVPASEADRYEGWIAVAPVAQGEPITRSGLREPASDSGLRAMSIPIETAHAVGGQLAPGDRIDVIRVVEGAPFYIASGIEVLATGERGSGGALGGIAPYSVTVAVDADTALHLAAAIASGDVEIVRATGADPVRVTPPGAATGDDAPDGSGGPGGGGTDDGTDGGTAATGDG